MMNPLARFLPFACLAVLAGLSAVPAFAAEAHVHGQARLTVALEGGNLTLALESPLANLLGFEHMPHGAKDKAAVTRIVKLLNRPGELFAPTPAAGCKPGVVKLESPVLEAPSKAASNHEEGGVHEHAHADLDAEFRFACAQPGLLRGLEVKLFDAFPGMKRLDVEVATDKGQAAAKLDGKRRRIDW